MNCPRRAGFSLLEMLLAMSILLGCLIVLSELAGIGRRHVSGAQGLATAQLVCQTKLNEMLSGAAPLESFQKQPVDNPPGWLCSVEINPVKQPGVAALRVTVWYEDPTKHDLDPELRRQHEFTLVQWIRDPYGPGGAGFGAQASSSLLKRLGGGQLP